MHMSSYGNLSIFCNLRSYIISNIFKKAQRCGKNWMDARPMKLPSRIMVLTFIANDKSFLSLTIKKLQLRPIAPDEVNLTPKLIRFT